MYVPAQICTHRQQRTPSVKVKFHVVLWIIFEGISMKTSYQIKTLWPGIHETPWIKCIGIPAVAGYDTN